MVVLLSPEQIRAARAGEPVRSVHDGTVYESIAEHKTVTTFIACRCCGAPLDRGSTALRVNVFARNAPRTARKPTSMALHVEDCLANGFVQTNGFGGRAPGYIRFVDGLGQIREAALDGAPSVKGMHNGTDIVPALKQNISLRSVVGTRDDVLERQRKGGSF